MLCVCVFCRQVHKLVYVGENVWAKLAVFGACKGNPPASPSRADKTHGSRLARCGLGCWEIPARTRRMFTSSLLGMSDWVRGSCCWAVVVTDLQLDIWLNYIERKVVFDWVLVVVQLHRSPPYMIWNRIMNCDHCEQESVHNLLAKHVCGHDESKVWFSIIIKFGVQLTIKILRCFQRGVLIFANCLWLLI